MPTIDWTLTLSIFLGLLLWSAVCGLWQWVQMEWHR